VRDNFSRKVKTARELNVYKFISDEPSTILIYFDLSYYLTSCCDLLFSCSSSLLAISFFLLSSSSRFCRVSSRNFILSFLALARASILTKNLGGLGTRTDVVRDLSLLMKRKRIIKDPSAETYLCNYRRFNLLQDKNCEFKHLLFKTHSIILQVVEST